MSLMCLYVYSQNAISLLSSAYWGNQSCEWSWTNHQVGREQRYLIDWFTSRITKTCNQSMQSMTSSSFHTFSIVKYQYLANVQRINILLTPWCRFWYMYFVETLAMKLNQILRESCVRWNRRLKKMLGNCVFFCFAETLILSDVGLESRMNKWSKKKSICSKYHKNRCSDTNPLWYPTANVAIQSL